MGRIIEFSLCWKLCREKWRDLIELHLMVYQNCPEGVKMTIQWVELWNFLSVGRKGEFEWRDLIE